MTDSKFHQRECDFGEKCYRKNPKHFEEFRHEHLNKLLNTMDKTAHTLPEDYKPKILKETIMEQLDILKNIRLLPESSNSLSHRKRPSTSSQSPANKAMKPNEENNLKVNQNTDYNSMPDTTVERTLSSGEHKERMQSARNMSEALSYFQEVKKRSQGNICDKLKAAAPFNFFLTSVTDSKQTHVEPLSLQMFNILDSSLGDLESSLQINFMVEFGWMMAQYHIANQRGKPITLLYGEMDVVNLDYKHITAVKVKPPSPFGSHHTKMCVLAYRDGSVRVCVHTSNLVESDWENRTQGVWLSPACPALPLTADQAAGESPTRFKRDLLTYLNAYRLSQLQPWVSKLRQIDFSQINVFFVASTPGSHKDRAWGHERLRALLKEHVALPPSAAHLPSSWPIVAQCSSIGSLGPQPTSWFCGEIKTALGGGLGLDLRCLPPIRLVYPSFENVASSYDGLLGGGCLPYSQRVHDKQPWLNEYLCQWKSDRRHRTRAVPHIKTYTRVSPDMTQLAFFHLTSANLSKAAWGSLTKAGALTILSYEAGVLFLPKFVTGSSTFRISEKAPGDSPLFPMPYDLPLTPFASTDVPWVMDNLA